jgi:succinate dehydrogenase / fumarate reductase, iron-sulfur subunit
MTAFRIDRWNPDDGQNSRNDTYRVDRDDCGLMVLDDRAGDLRQLSA